MNESIAFIGGGNMAASLIAGLLAAGWSPARLRVAVRTPATAGRLRASFGVDAGLDADAAMQGAGTVVLAVKPQQLADVSSLRIPPSATLISVLSGVRLESLARTFGGAERIVRTMPNTPARVGFGVTAAYAQPQATIAARERAEALFGAVGSLCWLDSEALIDPATVVSGCGPALFYAFVEALRDGGASLGLPPGIAARLARETFIGAARLAEPAKRDIAELRAEVTSKGGTTEAILAAFTSAELDGIVRRAMQAGVARAQERAAAAAAEIAS